MTDTKITELPTIAASDVATADLLPIVDASAIQSKAITFGSLIEALGSNGIVKFSTGPVADGAVNNGECYIYIDTGASPIVLTVKAKDGSGTVFTAVL